MVQARQSSAHIPRILGNVSKMGGTQLRHGQHPFVIVVGVAVVIIIVGGPLFLTCLFVHFAEMTIFRILTNCAIFTATTVDVSGQ